MEKVNCDCLNYCGDDPWLKEGKSEYCEAHKKRHKDEQEAEELRASVFRLVNSANNYASEYGKVCLTRQEIDSVFQYIHR